MISYNNKYETLWSAFHVRFRSLIPNLLLLKSVGQTEIFINLSNPLIVYAI